MNASLLPADLQSEMEKISNEKNHVTQIKSYNVLARNSLNDQLLVQNFSEQANKLKLAADKFVDVFKSDLKICLPKRDNSSRLINIDDELNSITKKMPPWKNVFVP